MNGLNVADIPIIDCAVLLRSKVDCARDCRFVPLESARLQHRNPGVPLRKLHFRTAGHYTGQNDSTTAGDHCCNRGNAFWRWMSEDTCQPQRHIQIRSRRDASNSLRDGYSHVLDGTWRFFECNEGGNTRHPLWHASCEVSGHSASMGRSRPGQPVSPPSRFLIIKDALIVIKALNYPRLLRAKMPKLRLVLLKQARITGWADGSKCRHCEVFLYDNIRLNTLVEVVSAGMTTDLLGT